MFRLGKRNFSLRDSPGKLSSISSSPKLQASPLKRLKLNNSCQLTSTFLRDSLIEEDEEVHVEQSKQIIKSPEKSIILQENSVSASIETPPPTPEAKTESKIEILTRQKAKLLEETKELDAKLEDKFQEVTMIRSEIADIGAQKLVYEDYVEIVNKGQVQARDILNQIYYPGNELANMAASFAEELRLKHQRKLDKLELELNSLIERAQKAIEEKKNSLEHEINLHERTLMTKENEKQIEVKNELAAETANDSEISCNNDQTDGWDRGDNEDCVILEVHNSDIISVKSNEESINVQSTDISGTKMGNDSDDDDTDIEDNQDEEARSFTPCQAQRPE